MYHLGKNSVVPLRDPRTKASSCRSKLSFLTMVLVALFAAPQLVADGSGSKKVRCGEQSLQRAIDKARPGSTLIITGSCDDGPYRVEKDLRLVGEGGAELLPRLQVEGATLHIERLKIIGDGMGVGGGGRIIADQIEIRDAFIGIGVLDLSMLEIRNSHIVNSVPLGIWGVGRSVLLVENTIIENCGVGIFLESTSSARIGSTKIVNGNTGLEIGRFSEAELFSLTIEGNTDYGILVSEKYAYVFMEDQSTIQNNSLADVRCDNRAIVEVVDTNSSTTGTTVLDPGCTLLGNPIF